ncbi:M15 family metallopeptidase [Flavitalea sp.]|nr:M15 family metallopeptidase [Flavitalea sp.]
MTVWIWCRSLSPRNQEDDELKGEFFDLSPFIERISTNVGKNGGNFQIVLPALECVLDGDNKWSLRKSTITQFPSSNEYVAQTSLYQLNNNGRNVDEVLNRSQFLFQNMIGTNDLVLIRFETLDMEKEQRYTDQDEFYVNKKNIAGRIYDMIGLIDSSTQVVSAASNDVNIQINGRDLSKLFLDDGVFFQALENSQGILKFAGQSTIKSPLINRLFADNGMSFIGLYMHTSIEHVLKFIMQQLAVIKIVPDELFSSYGDRRNKRYNVTNHKDKAIENSDYRKIHTEELASGIWQIVKLVIDKSVSQRRVADSSMSMANGSLINFINAVCQMPLVEYYADTYGDQYHLIVRKPPHDQKALISLIEGKINSEDGTVTTAPAIIDINSEDVFDEQLTFDDTEVYSWYHFYSKGALIGDAQNYSLSYLPAIYLPEYADIWGNRPMQKSHTYLPYTGNPNPGNALDLCERQALEDLKYVVETSQYLSFTRKGQIRLSMDRRLKIGNVIRYKPTGEIFFIDHVTHSFAINDQSIDATTTIHVSRGMIEQLIYGIYLKNENDEPRWVSYFNIVNTDLVFNEIQTSKKVAVRSKPIESTLVEKRYVNQSGNTGIYYLERYKSHPENRNTFIRFVNEINKLGYRVIITDTFRSHHEQWLLKYGVGGNINNAEPGTSRHEQGAAIDINLTNDITKERLRKNSSYESWVKSGVPALAKSMGIKWAGGSGSFGNYVDRVHFEIEGTPITRVEKKEPEYITKVEKTIDRNAVFSKYKVNKFSFNFFLKKLQFDPTYKNVTSRSIQEQGGQLLSEVEVIGIKNKIKK